MRADFEQELQGDISLAKKRRGNSSGIHKMLFSSYSMLFYLLILEKFCSQEHDTCMHELRRKSKISCKACDMGLVANLPA